ncbi:ComEA family DNA-binding protein [Actinomyces culturomici]|uniref:ComEA family DNA-binding protein n=1 Tax=Actinomyces culturomici TaxID=1926276 RepID=UPI000E205AB5|nr:helix-hairpin-helix domain-containing protein [Actinomyces culturomici]
MDLATRLRVRRLTRAVYRSVEEAPGERPARLARVLPSMRSVLVLVVVLVLVAGVGLWRAMAPSFAGPDGAESGRAPGAESGALANGGKNPGGVDEATAEAEEGSASGADVSASDGAVLLVVHVAGAAVSPGVVRVPAGSRVVDAIDAAGGPAADADLDALNLARPVVDGERIAVPRIGESPPAQASEGPIFADPSGSGAPGSDTGARSCIDLNTAPPSVLEGLDGVGPALAERIARFRESSGPFASVDDLDAVPGIGPALVERIRAGVCV